MLEELTKQIYAMKAKQNQDSGNNTPPLTPTNSKR
jgi:hypothetical protein